MTGVEERVRGFLENWRLTHCAICQDPIQDGKFKMIDGKLYCLACGEFELNKLNEPNEHNGHIERP